MTAPPIRRVIPAIAFALIVAACESTAPPPPVAAVTVVPVTVELVVGATMQLTAATWDASGGVLQGRGVTWGNSDPSVGTVSATGLVRALTRGSTTITATSEGRQATSVVIVHLPMGV
jgi:uncharacterized protein YjdB